MENLVIDNPYLSVHDWAEEYKGEKKIATGMIYTSIKSISEKIKLKSYELIMISQGFLNL